MSTCVISQPRLFPGLHYLHRMLRADIFVIFDSVQFSPRHEENRAKVKGPQGAQWLSVPVRQSHREQLIRDTALDDAQPWRRRLLGTLASLYGRAPRYKQHAPEIAAIVESSYATLSSLDVASWAPALRALGVRCEFVYASALPVSGKGPQLLLDICRHLGADVYLSGAFGREYIEVAEFQAAGVEVEFHAYRYPSYPQCGGAFVPFLSYLDMLFNVGLDRELVLAGGDAGNAVPELRAASAPGPGA
jgi:hypothetical protein